MKLLVAILVTAFGLLVWRATALKLFVGLLAAAYLHMITGLEWVLVVILLLAAGLAQTTYAQALFHLCGNNDPVAQYGARNLKHLRSIVQIPLWILLLEFVAKTLAWAGLFGVFIAIGWMKIE